MKPADEGGGFARFPKKLLGFLVDSVDQGICRMSPSSSNFHDLVARKRVANRTGNGHTDAFCPPGPNYLSPFRPRSMSEPVALNPAEAFGSDPSSQANFSNSKLSTLPKPPFEIPEELRGEIIHNGVLSTLDVPRYHDYKRLWELPVAIVLAVPALLMTAILMVLVRATSAGPGIYAQTRSGKNGKEFTMYKLRSMKADAEANGAQWCEGETDKRITPVGYWLRKLHLDELPQIINVLKGEMSFCGPRPERPEIVEHLEKCVPYYVSRLTVRPGITGYAQINLPADSGTVSVLKKQTLDLDYIENASLGSDLRMVGCTALRLVGVPGRIATKTAGLDRRPEDSKFSNHYIDLWRRCEKFEKDKLQSEFKA